VNVRRESRVEWFRRPAVQVGAALGGAATMWIASTLAVGVALTAPMAGFDEGDDAGSSVGALALVAAVLLYLGSGPVAYLIARRRWLLTLPLLGLIAWGCGISIAYVT
jgi:hypothetical protein